jgi:hypothetical protein
VTAPWKLTSDAMRTVVAALQTQVERGHFVEQYEGFNDCPATRGKPPKFDEQRGMAACTCGIRQAIEALEVLDAAIPPVGEWEPDLELRRT